MNNKLKKIVALCLAFAMVATVVLPESAYAKTKKTANYVTRAYVLQQVEKLIGATQTSDDVIQIKDVKKSSPYYKTMSIAVNAGLVKPDSNQKLHPTKKATNKYVASVLAKISETSTKNVLGKKTAATKLTKKSLKTFLNQKFPNVVSKCNLLEYLTQRDIQTKNSGVNVRYRGKHRFFKGFNEFIKEKTRRCDNDFEKIERHVFF